MNTGHLEILAYGAVKMVDRRLNKFYYGTLWTGLPRVERRLKRRWRTREKALAYAACVMHRLVRMRGLAANHDLP